MRLEGPKRSLGERLQSARKAAGLQQDQVAARLDVHTVTVSKWERDVQKPSAFYLDRLAEMYHVELRELLRGEPLSGEVPRDTPTTVSDGPGDESVSPAGPVPRHARNIPYDVRIYLDELRLRLTKARVPDEDVERAMDLLRSQALFSWYSSGTPHDLNADEVLQGVKAVAENVVLRRLRKLGRKV